MKLTYIAFILLFASCVTQQKCAERFPPKEADSIITVETLVHDTVYEYFQEESATIEDSGFGLDTLLYYHREEKQGKITARLDISKGKIKVTCREDAYKDTIAFLKKQITTTEKQTKVSPPKIEYREHWYHKPLIVYFGITSLLAVGFAAGKWFKVF